MYIIIILLAYVNACNKTRIRAVIEEVRADIAPEVGVSKIFTLRARLLLALRARYHLRTPLSVILDPPLKGYGLDSKTLKMKKV